MNRQQRRAFARQQPATPLLGRAAETAALRLQKAAKLSFEGKPREAADEFRRVLQIEPGNPVAHSNLGCVLTELGNFEEADASFRRAIALRPRMADPYSNFSYLMLKRSRYVEAQELAAKCVALDPQHANGWINLGCAAKAEGKLADAKRAFLRATAVAPKRAQAWCFLGDIYLMEQELRLAAQCFERAVSIDERNADAHGGLGLVLSCAKQWDVGIASLERALSLDPRNIRALMNLGAALYMESRADAARVAYRRAVELAPDNSAAKVKLATIMPLILRSHEEIATWHERVRAEVEGLVSDPSLKFSEPFLEVNFTNFHSGYFGLNDIEINRYLAQVFLHACPRLGWTSPHCGKATPSDRLRIGIITAFSKEHIVGELFQAIRTHFDPNRFEVIAFAPPRRGRDPENGAGSAPIVLPTSLFEAQQVVANAGLDVMFYLDCFVDPFIYFLSFARLAPVQCTTWGHPVTTGIPNIDYFISARDWESADADAHYTERLVRLNEMPMFFGEPPIPERPFDRGLLGLPPGARMYTCLQSLFKIHPDFDYALGNLLRRDKNAIVAMLTGDHRNWNKIFAERFREQFPDEARRLVFVPRLPRHDYLAMLKGSDAVLDPFHWGGGNTTIEALAAGVPVPTLPGPYLRGRLTLGFYRKIKMPELIARTPDEYIDLNCRIANDRDFHASLNAKVAAGLPRLYRNAAAIRELERFFIDAVAARNRLSETGCARQ